MAADAGVGPCVRVRDRARRLSMTEFGGPDDRHVRRRENHASVERRRRDNINECITAFARMVPELHGDSSRLNKGFILRKTVEYLEHVLATNADLEEQLARTEDHWRSAYRRAETMTVQADMALRRVRDLSTQNAALKHALEVGAAGSSASGRATTSDAYEAFAPAAFRGGDQPGYDVDLANGGRGAHGGADRGGAHVEDGSPSLRPAPAHAGDLFADAEAHALGEWPRV